jgi:hypothetical protein
MSQKTKSFNSIIKGLVQASSYVQGKTKNIRRKKIHSSSIKCEKKKIQQEAQKKSTI